MRIFDKEGDGDANQAGDKVHHFGNNQRDNRKNEEKSVGPTRNQEGNMEDSNNN